jgi:DNA-binding NtrC family response regulator
MISLHAFDGQRFGLSGAWSGPTPARISNGLVHSNGNGVARAAPAVPDGAVVITSLNVNDAEAKLIERALEVANGNRTRAADLLGISVRTLRNKLNGTKTDSDGGS